MEKKTIYDLHIGRTVRIICNAYAFVGVLKDIDLDRAVLNPVLVRYDTNIFNDVAIENRDATVNYGFIVGMQELDERFMQRYCDGMKEVNKLNHNNFEEKFKQIDAPKEGIERKLDEGK